MSDAQRDPELAQLLTDLTRTLRELEAEIEPERRPRLPTPRELSRFTSEVAIPGLILLLRTNIRALQLLQRTIRLANGREPTSDGAVSQARVRAERVGQASLSQLDGVLDELQSTLEGRPGDDEARELLSRARDLHEEVRSELSVDREGADIDVSDRPESIDRGRDGSAVDIDVESELQSIKDNLEDDPDETDSSSDSSDDVTDGAGDSGRDSDGPDDTSGNDDTTSS